jgi:outer membrane protein assembly factor BamA
VELVDEKREQVIITVEVDPGVAATVAGVELPGAARTRPAFVARLAGIRIGRRLADFDAEDIRETLLATDFFAEVGQPEIRRDAADRVTVVIPVRESAPGNFDLVMGYTPETSSAATGGLVGNGHLRLRNLFGGGRDMRLRLNRLPGRVSNVDVSMADPAVFGLPVGLEGSFRGVQQDSTYDQQQYGIHVTYGLTRNLSVVVGATREVTKPGQAGLVLRSEEQRIPRSTAVFLGAGMRFEAVDWPANPRRGLIVETMFERGNKNRTGRRVVASGDTLIERTRNRQERLRVLTRYFVPLARRQAVVIGVDARLLLSDDYDESDLIRFGGASSLRGYNEEQFVGRLAGRALLEVRHLLDRYAYAFVFADVGYLEVPDTPELVSARQLLPGFGFGIQFRTAVGLVNATYAFNDSDRVSDGRVHVGLSFNL